MNEYIQVLERKFGYFPVKFKWTEQVVEIDAVEQCRTEMWSSKESTVLFQSSLWFCPVLVE